MPVQDACTELQRGLARLKRIAASNAKDAIFLSQVGCSRSQWHAEWGVSGPCCITVIQGEHHPSLSDICEMMRSMNARICQNVMKKRNKQCSDPCLLTSSALCVRACGMMQVKAKMAGVQRDLDRAQAASSRAHQAAHVRDKNDSWAKF